MERKIISPKNDIVFKALFGQNDDILMNFLSDTLNIPLSEIEGLKVVNPELIPTTADGKLTRLDIKLATKTRNIDIEMQKAKEDDYRERILCYWASMYSEGIRKGEKYAELNQAISLNILDFNMFGCEEYRSSFFIYEQTRKELFSDKLALYFFELNKVGKDIDAGNRQKIWLQLINADNEKELEDLDNTNISIIQKSIDTIHRLSDDDKIREMVRLREEADALDRSRIYNAEKRGMDKGRAEGRAEGRTSERNEIIRIMLNDGRSVSEIAELLHLKSADIEQVRKSLLS